MSSGLGYVCTRRDSSRQSLEPPRTRCNEITYTNPANPFNHGTKSPQTMQLFNRTNAGEPEYGKDGSPPSVPRGLYYRIALTQQGVITGAGIAHPSLPRPAIPGPTHQSYTNDRVHQYRHLPLGSERIRPFVLPLHCPPSMLSCSVASFRASFYRSFPPIRLL